MKEVPTSRRRGIFLNMLVSVFAGALALLIAEGLLRAEETWRIEKRLDAPLWPPPVALGAYRILGIGDSFTYGQGVKSEDTYLKQLESRLRRRYPGRSFQTINLGVPGYNTVQEYELLARSGPAYHPHLIVVGFVLNDTETVLAKLHSAIPHALHR